MLVSARERRHVLRITRAVTRKENVRAYRRNGIPEHGDRLPAAVAIASQIGLGDDDRKLPCNLRRPIRGIVHANRNNIFRRIDYRE